MSFLERRPGGASLPRLALEVQGLGEKTLTAVSGLGLQNLRLCRNISHESTGKG